MNDRPGTASEAVREDYTARTVKACQELAERTLLLSNVENVSRETSDGRSAGAPGPTIPFPPSVLDLLTEIHKFVHEYAPVQDQLATPILIRARRAGKTPLAAVVDRLQIMAACIEPLARMDPDLTWTMAKRIWLFNRRAGQLLGLHERPYAVADLCPKCGGAWLWVDPERWVHACIFPGCSFQSSMDSPVPTSVDK